MHSAHEKGGSLHHCFVELSVREDDEDEKALWTFKQPGPKRSVTSICCFTRVSGEDPIYNDNSPAGQDAFETECEAGKSGPWRELEVEVSWDRIVAKCAGKQVAQIKQDVLQRRTHSLLKARGNLAFQPPLVPRSGLGLYVLGSSASFRLGAIEPLP
jgi:hypothetical protein